jgi:hypothetical protein
MLQAHTGELCSRSLSTTVRWWCGGTARLAEMAETVRNDFSESVKRCAPYEWPLTDLLSTDYDLAHS